MIILIRRVFNSDKRITDVRKMLAALRKDKSRLSSVIAMAAAVIFAAASGLDGMQSYVSSPEAKAKKTVNAADVTDISQVVVKLESYYGRTTAEESFSSDALSLTEQGYSVYADGRFLGSVSLKGKENLENHIASFLASYNTEKAEAATKLNYAIEYKEGEFDSLSIVPSQEILAQLDLQAITTYSLTESEEVAFETVYEDSDKLFVGTTAISCEGETGVVTKTYEVTEVNGEIVSKNQQTEKVEKEAVAEITLVGTKTPLELTAEDIKRAGELVFPLTNAKYYVSSAFGYREFDDSFHNGTDYAANEGTEVYAAANGEVVFAGWDETGYGNYVLIEHENGYRTGYAHLSSISVEKGDSVAAGDVVGGVGSTGYSTGNHLHLNVFYNGEYVDPEQLFK